MENEKVLSNEELMDIIGGDTFLTLPIEEVEVTVPNVKYGIPIPNVKYGIPVIDLPVYSIPPTLIDQN